jgi:hypothetical protein
MLAATLARQTSETPPVLPNPDAATDQPPVTAPAPTPKPVHRPAPNHPWRHAPIGRARFRNP